MESHCFPLFGLPFPRLAGSIALDPADPLVSGLVADANKGGNGLWEVEKQGEPSLHQKIENAMLPWQIPILRRPWRPAPSAAFSPLPADRGPWTLCETMIPDDPAASSFVAQMTAHHHTPTG